MEEDEQRSLSPRLGLRRHHDVDAELPSHRLTADVHMSHARPVLIHGREDRRGEGEIDDGGRDHGEDDKRSDPAPPDLRRRRAVVHTTAG